jgi:hypothetical protein
VKVFPYQLPNGKVIVLRPVSAAKRREAKMICLLISGWLDSLSIPCKTSPIDFLKNNNAKGQGETIAIYLSEWGLNQEDVSSLDKDLTLEILKIIENMDVEPSIVPDITEGFILPSCGDSEGDLIADLISIFDVQSALQIYSTLDFVTIQLVLKRLQFQSKRQELEERYNKNIAVSQLIELKNSGKWDNLNWSDKYPGIS